MTQGERDRLVVLKKALKKQIKQSQAAQELGLSARQVKRLLRGLRVEGDKAVIHHLRGRASQRKISVERREQIVRILSREVYRGFGPTLASEYLGKKHQVQIGREALRQIMAGAGLWRVSSCTEMVHRPFAKLLSSRPIGRLRGSSESIGRQSDSSFNGDHNGPRSVDGKLALIHGYLFVCLSFSK